MKVKIRVLHNSRMQHPKLVRIVTTLATKFIYKTLEKFSPNTWVWESSRYFTAPILILMVLKRHIYPILGLLECTLWCLLKQSTVV